jgi:GTP-binding protein Era
VGTGPRGDFRSVAPDSDSRTDEHPAFKAGTCALIGLPNVGKSTLLNRLVEERLSIVTPRPQTTRRRLLGIYTDDRHQAVFIDTPGLLEPRYLLQRAMLAEADMARSEADVVVYVVDVGYPASVEGAREFGARSRGRASPAVLLCLNKADRLPASRLVEVRAGLEAFPWGWIGEAVATADHGVQELRAAILERLPESPPLYPEDEISTASLRYLAAEFVRETAFEELSEEVPYAVAVGVDEFREGEEPVYIAATIFVERESQKGIVIGAKGRMIRKIGTRSRHKIERLVGRSVYLDLRVKVLHNWRRQVGKLKLLGFPTVPGER